MPPRRRPLLVLLVAGAALMLAGWLLSIGTFRNAVSDVHRLRLETIDTYRPMVEARNAGRIDDVTWRAAQVRIRETRDVLNAMDGAADAKRWWNPASAYRYDRLRGKAVEGLRQLQNLRDVTPATTRSTA